MVRTIEEKIDDIFREIITLFNKIKPMDKDMTIITNLIQEGKRYSVKLEVKRNE